MEDSFDLFGGLPSAGGGGSKEENASKTTMKDATPSTPAIDLDLFGGLPIASCGGSDGTIEEKFKVLPPPPPPKTSEISVPPSAVTDKIRAAKPYAPTTSTSELSEKKDKSDDNVAKDEPPEKEKEGTSLVSAIGNSGTAMAFVPQAIRKKKKVAQQLPPSKPKHVPLKKRKFVGAIIETHEQNQLNNANKLAFKRSNSSERKWEDNAINNKESSNDKIPAEGVNIEPYLEKEPESLRLLHASVTPQNQYNPHCPNDYLAWRERKKTEQVRKDLQRKALERLDEQARFRKKIEEERKKILQSGDLTKIADGAGAGRGRGRGRGRGASNLPAWLIKKQQEQQKAESAGSKANDGQFDNA